MSKLISLICASLMAIAAAGAAAAGELPGTSNAAYSSSARSADDLFQRVATKPCCYNNRQFFRTTPKTCYRNGGRVVAAQYCERRYDGGYGGYGDDSKPCCYNNGQFFNTTPKTCRRYGGRVVSQDRCHGYQDEPWDNDGYRPNSDKPCCYNNGQYFNTTPKTCRKNGGQTVRQEYCSYRN
jgi:hypothetical protein